MTHGQTFTFYSYKGGVGRSMALANIAMLFYRQGYTTLVVDWDLEAPGLERYFSEAFDMDAQAIADSPGLIDLIDHYMDHAARTTCDSEGDAFPKIAHYIHELDSHENAKFLLMHAGRRSSLAGWDRYTEFIQTFNWGQFYDEWAGGAFFDWLRAQFRQYADVILIDSRTGVTEMGGVATQHLADVIVLLCGANIQNIENSARMAAHFTSAEVRASRDNRPLELIVAPSRIDDSDCDRYNEFLDRFDVAFAHTPMHALDDGYSMQQMLIPYFPLFSFTEELVVDNPAVERPAHRLRESYRRIMSNMKRLATPNSSLNIVPNLSEGLSIRVGLVSTRTDAPVASTIRNRLVEEFDVIDLVDRSIRPVDGLTASNVLVPVLGENASESELIRNFISWAFDENMPILPVALENGRLPFEISGLQPLHISRFDKRSADTLISAIRQRLDQDTDQQQVESDDCVPEIFMSFSNANRVRAKPIADRLRQEGFRIWSRHRIPIGALISAEIESAIQRAVAMVVLVSSTTQDSPTVTLEWNMMRQQGKPLIPVRIFENSPMPFLLIDTQSEDCLSHEDLEKVVARVKRETSAGTSRPVRS